jgi:hypothetical protein
MGKLRNLKGKRFGKVVVLYLAEKRTKSGGVYWWIKCDCGKEKEMRGSSLTTGASLSCGCRLGWNIVPEDLKGQCFGNLTVLRDSGKRAHNRGALWSCQCSCGKIKNIRADALKSGATTSCGCVGLERLNEYRVELGEGISAFNSIFAQYKAGARRRGLSFSLTKEQFKDIILSKCHYCGGDLSNYKRSSLTGLAYNGVDRIDSEVGYRADNAVSCCSKCNRMKTHHSVAVFKKHIDKIYNHQHNVLHVTEPQNFNDIAVQLQ